MMKYLDLDGARYIVATIQNLLNGKVSKDGSKVLSTNDYTTTEKNKLAGIAASATKVETSTTIGNLKINGVEKQIIPLMSAASSSAAGKAGLVPAPAQNKHTSFLRGDGTWAIPTNTTYSNATTSKDGLMSSEDKTKLDGIATGANKYVHPTTPGNKHIPSGGSTGQVLKWSSNGTAVWGTDNNTTYTNATTSKDGLMSQEDKVKLDSIKAGDSAPLANGVANAGTSNAYAREDHKHPLQTTISGNAGSATKLQTARTIALSGAATGTATSFNGTTNITIPVTSLDASKLTGTTDIDTTGNAATATKLQTARTINGVNFDGTKNITITASVETTELESEDLDDIRTEGEYYATENNEVTSKPSSVKGFYLKIYRTGSLLKMQELTDNNGEKYIRRWVGLSWSSWEKITYSLATSSSNGLLSSSDYIKLSKVTSTEMGYLDGVTSSIQTQLNNKAPTSHASSSTTYGVATSSSYGHAKVINNLTTSSSSNGYALHAYQGYLLNNRLEDVEDIICTRFTIDASSFKYDAIIKNIDISNPIMVRINGTIMSSANGKQVLVQPNTSKTENWFATGFRNNGTSVNVYAFQGKYLAFGEIPLANKPANIDLTIDFSKRGYASFSSKVVCFCDNAHYSVYVGGGNAVVGLSDFNTLEDLLVGMDGANIKGVLNVEVWSQAPSKTITESPKAASASLNSIDENNYEKII